MLEELVVKSRTKIYKKDKCRNEITGIELTTWKPALKAEKHSPIAKVHHITGTIPHQAVPEVNLSSPQIKGYKRSEVVIRGMDCLC